MSSRRRPEDSSIAKEAKQQALSGRGGAQAAESPGTGSAHQARQGANRNEMTTTPPDRPGFAPGHAPSEQGDLSSPSAERIRSHEQGYAGTGTGKSGSHATGPDRSEEEAVSGAPRGDQVRHGRQHVRNDHGT